MDFNELLNDIAKLEGLNLQSIRPGANITIEKVDLKQGKIIVINSSGKVFSRSIIEFQRIWEELLSEPAVRVEEALRGSGSSRNQPETIFANLPYIEWLKISNKKHIAYIGKESHPYGTLKQMNSSEATNILFQAQKTNLKCVVIVSTNSLVEETKLITSLLGVASIGISQEVYKFETKDITLYCVSCKSFNLLQGTYCEMNLKVKPEFKQKIYIDDTQFGVFHIGHLNGIMRL